LRPTAAGSAPFEPAGGEHFCDNSRDSGRIVALHAREFVGGSFYGQSVKS